MIPEQRSHVPCPPRAAALLPLLSFLVIFLGSGLYFQMQNTEYAFYQIATPVAALPAILLAVFLSRDKLNATIEDFLKGAGHSHIMAMCIIYLLAGAFSSVAKATGGVDATVALALALLPDYFLLPGIFLVSGFISTAMGTSMGTIAALAPIALGIAGSAGLPLPLVAGTVVGGAMFGDNLSIISDTTIAATRSQGCQMRDKFRVNIFIALPAALLTIGLLLGVQGSHSLAVPEITEIILVLPYLGILALALSGLNVFAVLTVGLLLSGGVGFAFMDSYNLVSFSKDIYAGFTNMQEIFILSMFIGGLSALMKKQGGLAFLSRGIEKLIAIISQRFNSGAVAEAGIAAMVGLTNACTANNTVSIIVTGSVARELAEKHQVSPRRSASILDVFSCVCQGLLPYGAQTLLAASIFGIAPLAIVGKTYYCFILALIACADIVREGMKRAPAPAQVIEPVRP